MLIDLEKHGGPDVQPLKAAVCIAGAGIAGLVLAGALAESGLDVVLLEAGGYAVEDRSQQVYEAEMTEGVHAGTSLGRFRVFGGSSLRWGGQLLPYTEDIFSPGQDSVSAKWPINATVLEPYYRRAEAILGADHLPYTADLYRDLKINPPKAFERHPNINLRFSKWAPFSHRNLARTLGSRAVKSDRITVVLHANLAECLVSADRTKIEAFLVRNYNGRCVRFEAEQYVLATGTIETSRLLLASRAVFPEGVGNDHDQVGRGFHDHVSAPIAQFIGPARRELLSRLGPIIHKSTLHTARLEAKPVLRRRFNLLSVDAHITIEEPEGSGGDEARQILRSIQRGEFRKLLAKRTVHLPAACLYFARLAYAKKFHKRRAVSNHAIVRMHVGCEQVVKPSNRIRLSDNSRDALGMPRAVVDWRVAPEEKRTIAVYAGYLREQLSRVIGPSIRWNMDAPCGQVSDFPQIRDTNHPMGGTIMGLDSKASVVDTHLRVHEIANLYIASCSTYPSGGSSNPTFTLVALTLRLADRLKQIASRVYWASTGPADNV